MAPWKWNIYWADLDPVKGSEQAGKRPVLIVSSDVVNEVLSVVTVLPITSIKPGRIIYPTEAVLKATENGLSQDSIAMAHQMRAIMKGRLSSQCGQVTQPQVKEAIEQAMRIYLEL